MDIANTGGVAGAEVAQLYLTYPPAANEPPRQLRGFEKLWLLPGQKGTARFEMTARSVSIWDVAAHVSTIQCQRAPIACAPTSRCEQVWTVQRGEFAVAVGASSADTRLRGSFNV